MIPPLPPPPLTITFVSYTLSNQDYKYPPEAQGGQSHLLFCAQTDLVDLHNS